ncbi:MAG: zf-HC2 domain-containing protein, partial [Candidatus Obscuribacterales bacterium]|nr:zf-HC2 domain-containing protein [Steroidobacteraceae bacterium]
MNITDEMLMAYADGELDVATRAEIERAIAANSELAKQVAGHRALRIQLNNTFDSVLAEAVPARLNTAVSES